MKRLKVLLVLVWVVIIILTGCSAHVCDKCKKEFRGDAYYDVFSYERTYCAPCAADYYAPLPIGAYKK